MGPLRSHLRIFTLAPSKRKSHEYGWKEAGKSMGHGCSSSTADRMASEPPHGQLEVTMMSHLKAT